jgi:hypothetical protein
MKPFFISILISLLPFFVIAQIPPHSQADYVIHANKIINPISLDGVDLEPEWQGAKEIGDFWQKFPTADKKTTTKTTVKALFDDQNVYFLIEAYDSTNKYVAPSLKRDATIRESDGIAIVLDPVNKKSNGFSFSVTPNNVQTEYQFGGGSEDITLAWDNKWFSETKRYKNKYVVEIAIPFKTLRYDANNKSWGINFIRSDQKKNEFSTWTNIPVQFRGFDLGYTGILQLDGDLIPTRLNAAFIPYVTGRLTENKEKNIPTSAKANMGFDAKVAVSPSLNLDLTFNPDFSQVEVDQQVTNLTRFSIFFPERRTFFLENNDIFGEYGAPPFRPFFSRSIGLDKNAQPIPIVYGARLSGNLSEKTRIGFMNMQTKAKGDFPGQNYTATSLIQRVGSRSSLKTYFLNRYATGLKEDEKIDPLDKFGRNLGTEFNYTDKTGIYQAWAGYHHSFKENIKSNQSFYQIGGGIFGEKVTSFIDFDNFGKNYYADMGFINRIETYAQQGPDYDNFADTTIRAAFKQVYNENTYTFRPKNSSLVQLVFGVSNYVVWFQNNTLSDRTHTLSSRLGFRNTTSIALEYNIQEDNLKYYFPLPENKPLEPGNYKYSNLNIKYTSDSRKNYIFSGGFTVGKLYNGVLNQYSTSLTLRKQPVFNTVINVQYNDIKFPEAYGRTKLWLVGPKIELTFTNKLFWTNFLQFNTQANNFNINSRVQYRYSPMSDFFLVYSDNYFSDPLFKNKNRAIVFKLNYWLNV